MNLTNAIAQLGKDSIKVLFHRFARTENLILAHHRLYMTYRSDFVCVPTAMHIPLIDELLPYKNFKN